MSIWGAERRCRAIKYIGDAGYFRLECSLEENHPELHWDRSYEVVWTHWTENDEREERRSAV